MARPTRPATPEERAEASRSIHRLGAESARLRAHATAARKAGMPEWPMAAEAAQQAYGNFYEAVRCADGEKFL